MESESDPMTLVLLFIRTMFIVRVSKGFPDVMSSLIVMFTLIDLMRGLHSILAAVQHHHLKHCPILFSRSLKLHPKTTVSFDSQSHYFAVWGDLTQSAVRSRKIENEQFFRQAGELSIMNL